ncbi:MAG: sulfite exporter TauE/SafE family protein [Draconibacterium sp.]|nr:sulfite exporter TauE/SafE family protein [Draconibacterium sp.]
MSITHLVILILIGVISGLLAGVFGIGGAIIVIPALVFILGLSQHDAQGTSLAFMLPPVGILATWNYWKAGHVDWKIALVLSLTFVVGAYFGSQFSINISDKILRRVFGVLMLVMAVKMIFSK